MAILAALAAYSRPYLRGIPASAFSAAGAFRWDRRPPPLAAFASVRHADGARVVPPKNRGRSGGGDGAMTSPTSPRSPAAAGGRAGRPNRGDGAGAGAKAVARRVSASPSSLAGCGSRLRSGGLVAFPTETVYGLGCHALDPAAVAGVFKAKERPLSDPLIVHVARAEDALSLWSASSSSSSSSSSGAGGDGADSALVESRALRALSSAFWPGPLTVVARASPSVPPIVTASTGYVACRAPSHPVARAVIDYAGVPIAAPSANKFGHVSPTRADHVLDDLGGEDVWVVDPSMRGDGDDGGVTPAADGAASANGEGVGGNGDGDGDGRVCEVGVESTVAKVEMTTPASGKVLVLRHGAISVADLRRVLRSAGLADSFDVSSVIRSTAEDATNVAPGQTVRHYSPRVPSYMIAHSRYGGGGANGDGDGGGAGGMGDLTEVEADLLGRAVVIDFGRRLEGLRTSALAYRDLSPSGCSSEAASRVFEALRWAEAVGGAERVYFPEVPVPTDDAPRDGGAGDGGGADGEGGDDDDALAHAVRDRLTRAASGKIVETLQ